MKNKFLNVICIMLSSFLLLTACGEQADPSGVGTTASELSAGKPSGADASIPEPGTTATSAQIVQTEPGRPESDVSGEGIVVANLYGESSFFSGRVVSFGRENPAYGIQYQAAYEGEEADRILMEVVNGKGPDILYLNRRNMEPLQANRALGEIGQLISQENWDALLPGAIQMGTHEDKLFAIPLSVYARSLLTSRAYWQNDSWTVEDILSVAEEHQEIEGLFLDITGAEEYFYNLYFMIGMDIKNSPFLKDGSSKFDCQEFRDILMTIKNKTHKAVNNSAAWDRMLPLTEGNYLGIECFLTGMKNYCDIYEKMGDNVNLVGYPCDMGSSHYLVDNGMLVINQNAMTKEGIKELVNDLLSLESQKYVGYAISVRMDIPESQLVYNAAGKNYIWTSPDNKGFQLSAKADGTSYLEEYVEFLKSAVPATFDSDEIFNMVMEEADSYFNSNKDVDQVIDIIQRRVQVYLDERK